MDLAPGFTIKHILKDLRLVRETIQEGKSLPGVELCDRLFKSIAQLDRGQGEELDTQAMIRAYLEAE